MKSTTKLTAARLLGIPDIDTLAESIVARSVLPGGRVEAHEFGRGQHSSASAGAVLVGIKSSACLSEDAVRPLTKLALGLIGADGKLRGHDSDAESGATTWAMSQVLLGLSLATRDAAGGNRQVAGLARRLVAMQDHSGGWPLRADDEPHPAFSFYPSLALSQLVGTGVLDPVELVRPLRASANHLRGIIEQTSLTVEEQLLAHFAYERIRRSLSSDDLPSLTASRRQAVANCWDSERGLLLTDRPVAIYRQPVWHSIMWHPLFYLCLRKWRPPLDPVNAAIGGALIKAFDNKIGAWPGPASMHSGLGSSWASALALRATMALAADLTKADVTVDEFAVRAAQVDSRSYRYDVAISFAGADRLIAEAIAARMKSAGLRTFYDRDYQHALLGEDLGTYLHSTYFRDSRFAVVIVSHAFMASKWAGNWEWRAVLARMQQQTTGYVLPYVLEEVPLPGLNPTTGYVAASECSPDEFAGLVIRKARSQNR